MAPNQRLALAIMWSLLLLWVGRLWLFTTLTSKPEDIATNIQGDLQEKISDEQQNQVLEQPPLSWNILATDTVPTNWSAKIPTPFPLTVLLPPRTKKEKITELMNRIDPEKNFQVTLFQPTTITTYLRAIDAMVTGDRQADIILLPRQEKERIHQWSTQIDRSATPPPVGQFHPQVGKLITDSKSMFIPHALDPRVTITQAETKNLSLGTFLQTHLSPLSFLSGQVPADPLVETLSNIWLDQLFSAANISLITKIFRSTTTEPCLQRTCLSSWTTALRLPLSELTPEEIDSFLVSIFPSLDETVPTTVRGWVVRWNDASAYTRQRLLRIQKYLAVMSNDQLPYESPLLPAYFPRLSRLLLQDEWAWLQRSVYKLTILEHSSKQLQHWFSILPLEQLLDKSYRPELYLEKRQEIRTQETK